MPCVGKDMLELLHPNIILLYYKINIHHEMCMFLEHINIIYTFIYESIIFLLLGK